MNILIIVIIGLVCFAIGSFFGAKGARSLENMAENMEKAASYIESVGDTGDIDQFNTILNQHRDDIALMDIELLLDLEEGNIELAKEKLINTLASDYLDIKDDEIDGTISPDSQNVIARIDQLAKEHVVFQKIIRETQGEE